MGSRKSETRLLRLHRRSLTNLLVLGGTRPHRTEVALEFHRQSPLRLGPFVVLYGERDDERLSRALASRLRARWEHTASDPLLAAEGGTLFFDSFERFSTPTQRLLLDFVRTATPSPSAPDGNWAGRLAAGSDFDLSLPLPRSEGDPSPLVELFDCLDKIRIDLEPALAGGWS